MSTEGRLLLVESAVVMLTQLVKDLDERLDTHQEWINLLGEAQANTDIKIAALADAQIKTEESLGKLVETENKLAEAQLHTDRRLDALIDIVRESKGDES